MIAGPDRVVNGPNVDSGNEFRPFALIRAAFMPPGAGAAHTTNLP